MRSLEEVLAAHPLPLYNPDGTLSELTGMQKEDIIRMAEKGRVLGDLPVGYGKTAIATAAALMLDVFPVVILVPPILIPQWVKWLRSIPGAGKVVSYYGNPRERDKLALSGARFIVTSYVMFKKDLKRLRTELGPRTTVMDEAQNAKNHQSQMFKALRDFSEGQPLLLMSGTIMSKPSDGFSYVKLNNPEVYPRYINFTNLHVAKWDFFDNPVEWMNLDLLQANLDLSRVKRTKEEVHANLPKVNWIPIEYQLDKEHQKLYEQLMNEQLLEVPDGKIDATTAGKLYSYSQQIIANWGHFAEDPDKRPALYDVIDTVLDEIALGEPPLPGEPPRSKLIIWTVFKRTSRSVLAYLNGKAKGKWRAVGAYGEVNSAKGVQAFMEDPDALILVAQHGSAGVGLNPQGFCWEMLFAEFPTTTIPFLQCVGRIDRTGQIYNPNVRMAIAMNTVQQALRRSLFTNDELVVKASGDKRSMKDLIFPK